MVRGACVTDQKETWLLKYGVSSTSVVVGRSSACLERSLFTKSPSSTFFLCARGKDGVLRFKISAANDRKSLPLKGTRRAIISKSKHPSNCAAFVNNNTAVSMHCWWKLNPQTNRCTACRVKWSLGQLCCYTLKEGVRAHTHPYYYYSYYSYYPYYYHCYSTLITLAF